MPVKANNVKKKLDKKVIQNLGQDVTYRRMLSNNQTSSLDDYGEPTQRTSDGSIDLNSFTNYTEKTVRIVVDEFRIEESLTSIGGTPSKKEFARLYLSSSEDIKIGDQLIINGNTYEIEIVKPNYLQNVNIIWEVEAYRDRTT